MNLVVQLAAGAAEEVTTRGTARPEVSALLKTAEKLGIHLAPMHPGSADAGLRTWFRASLDGASDAEAIAQKLLAHPLVVAAYPKPPDALP